VTVYAGAGVRLTVSSSSGLRRSHEATKRVSTAAVLRKRLALEARLYQILWILSGTLFEKTTVLRALQASGSENDGSIQTAN
jgi:hypothetical protein